MEFGKIEKSDFEEWLKMGLMLWPKYTRKKLRKEFEEILSSKREQAFLCKDQENHIGSINISIRKEYVSGAKFYPVGYVEGIYVKKKYRKKGVAKKLSKCGGKWAKSKKCREMGSDTWLWNKDSQKFHRKLGFKKSSVLVNFVKKLS